MISKVVLIRHGESTWNKKKLFTGWIDVDLSPKGILQARHAGKILLDNNFTFDIAYTSVLSRAVKTLWHALEECEQVYIPIINAWQLNERHYGGLQGLNKEQMIRKVGEAQVHIWRRSYDIRPPKIDKEKYQQIATDSRYAGLKKSEIPWHESLEDTCKRVWPYWQANILPQILKGKNILIAAHGNSLRGLVKHLDNISDEDIPNLEIPYAEPLVYEFEIKNKKASIVKKYYLHEKRAHKKLQRAHRIIG